MQNASTGAERHRICSICEAGCGLIVDTVVGNPTGHLTLEKSIESPHLLLDEIAKMLEVFWWTSIAQQ